VDLYNAFEQMPFDAPTVFNFFQADYSPSGAVASRGLVAPEAQILTAPNLVAWLNGATSLFKFGLSSCGGGFVNTWPNPGSVCWRVEDGIDPPHWAWAGNCTFAPSLPLSSLSSSLSPSLSSSLSSSSVRRLAGVAGATKARDVVTEVSATLERKSRVVSAVANPRSYFFKCPNAWSALRRSWVALDRWWTQHGVVVIGRAGGVALPVWTL